MEFEEKKLFTKNNSDQIGKIKEGITLRLSINFYKVKYLIFYKYIL